jgi:hypothetical protein
LLILGFLRLAWVSFAIDALPRPLTQSDNEMFQSTNSYSGQQLRKMVIGVVANYHMCIPGVILPAALMLAGGVLLDQAARRDKKRKPPIIQDERPVAS